MNHVICSWAQSCDVMNHVTALRNERSHVTALITRFSNYLAAFWLAVIDHMYAVTGYPCALGLITWPFTWPDAEIPGQLRVLRVYTSLSSGAYHTREWNHHSLTLDNSYKKIRVILENSQHLSLTPVSDCEINQHLLTSVRVVWYPSLITN